MTTDLDFKLKLLKAIEDSLTKLSDEKEILRKELFSILEQENLGQYKNDIATISQMERKTIKYIKPVEELINELPEKYITLVPEEVIPEHKELNKTFEQEVKDGIKIDGVELQVKSSPVIRFK